METFINFIESRKRQVDAIHSIMTTLHYEKGISPEDILNMETSELQDLVKDMRPTENWSMPRFVAMLKSYAAGTFNEEIRHWRGQGRSRALRAASSMTQ